jgi:hypothetical protein
MATLRNDTTVIVAAGGINSELSATRDLLIRLESVLRAAVSAGP